MKKAQIMAQPFIIIFALLVAVLVLAFGFKTVLDLKEKGDFAQLLDSQAEIKEVARSYLTLGEGSIKTLDLRVPRDTNCFCFLDRQTDFNDPSHIADIENAIADPFCGEKRQDFVKANILTDAGSKQLYVLPSNSFAITNFDILSNSRLGTISTLNCIHVNDGRLQITFTSKSRFVEIS